MTYLGAQVKGRETADYILTEGNGSISREEIVIAQSGVIEPGTVLGQVTATKKYVALDVAQTDGSQVAVAVNYARIDATNGDVPCVISARDSELKKDQLIWPAGITEPQKAAAIAQLEAKHLIVR